MRPRREGWAVLRELRQTRRTAPVVSSTARDPVEERVKDLDLGVDGHLV
jgi:DNA-binding response OmpR family regulator